MFNIESMSSGKLFVTLGGMKAEINLTAPREVVLMLTKPASNYWRAERR